MSPSLESLFNDARALHGVERDAYLDRVCADNPALRERIEQLLCAHEELSGFLLTEPGDDPDATIRGDSESVASGLERQGDRIDRYLLLQQIGEGGFGSVWMADQQEPVRRKVALKIIKLGMDTKQVIARFEAERQALALMDHPNIATVFDAGITKTGRPYFVMEYIRGVPIVDYCDEARLDTRARLELCVKVCNAVQHAHQKGVIHRDIKPGNVLVTLHDGVPVPKVIDFGIAKATNAELTHRTLFTEHRQVIGTPAYMAPEQAEMSGLNIDTRCDVYSLGVLLYEMLTGSTPFESSDLFKAGLEEMLRIIREVDPPKPSTRVSSLGDASAALGAARKEDPRRLSSIMRGDLDWIVMRCLDKDRTRRYESASGLAADIGRHLLNEPVEAGPPSATYRFGKFVRRNRVGVFTAGAVSLALVLGLSGTTFGLLNANEQRGIAIDRAEAAERERKRAQEETARANAATIAEADARAAEARRAEELRIVAEFQAERLKDIELELMGVGVLNSILNEIPEAKRENMERTLAPVNFTNVAVHTIRKSIFSRTVNAIDDTFPQQPVVRARLLHSIGAAMRSLGMYESARDALERAYTLRRESIGDDSHETLESYREIGALERDTGHLGLSEDILSDAINRARASMGPSHELTLGISLTYAELLTVLGRMKEAERLFRDVLVLAESGLGESHAHTRSAMHNVGFTLLKQQRYEEAEPILLEAYERDRDVFGEYDPATLVSLSTLGDLAYATRQYETALERYQGVYDGFRRAKGDNHPDTLTALNEVGVARFQTGDPEGAFDAATEVLRGEQTLGAMRPSAIMARSNVGFLLRARGEYEEAEPYLLEALRANLLVHGEAHPRTINAMNSLAFLLNEMGRNDEAERQYREALRVSRDGFGDDHPQTLIVLANLAALLRDADRHEEALPIATDAYEGAKSRYGETHPETLYRMSDLISTLHELEMLKEAQPLIIERLRLSDEPLDSTSDSMLYELYSHANKLIDAGMYEEAEVVALEHEKRRRLKHERGHPDIFGAIRLMIRLYDEWHVALPEAGYDARAAEWRARLEAETNAGEAGSGGAP